MSDYWFRPKRYGYGAEPANWKGWLATLVLAGYLIAAAFVFVVLPQRAGQEVTSGMIATWALFVLPVILAFIYLSWIKTDGDWKWRWGSGDR